VNIQLNIVICSTYPDKFIFDNDVAPSVLFSVVIVTPPFLTVTENRNLKSRKYVCITTYQPDAKSNPNPNATTKRNAVVSIQQWEEKVKAVQRRELFRPTILRSFLQWRLPTSLRTVLSVLRASRFSSRRRYIFAGLRKPIDTRPMFSNSLRK